MRRMKKFAQGGRATRAQGKMDRRMADIEKDFQRALAKGKSEKVARAKRDQRIADAKDDFAKRTGADRTETRAAEKEAQARLRRARRSPDKNMQPVTVADEAAKARSEAGSLASAKVDTPKLDVPKVGGGGYDDMSFSAAFRQAMRDKGRGNTFTWKGESYKLETAGSAPSRSAGRSGTRSSGTGTGTGTGTSRPQSQAGRTAGAVTGMAGRAATTARLGKLVDDVTRPGASATSGGKDAGKSSAPTTGRTRVTGEDLLRSLPGTIRRRGEASDPTLKKAKGGKVKKYAKGGKIDGIALRGKTRATRKK
jgi:hypothetical protein